MHPSENGDSWTACDIVHFIAKATVAGMHGLLPESECLANRWRKAMCGSGGTVVPAQRLSQR